MGNRFDLFWLLRLRCRAIADVTPGDGEFRIQLCRRWRWHRGTCE